MREKVNNFNIFPVAWTARHIDAYWSIDPYLALLLQFQDCRSKKLFRNSSYRHSVLFITLDHLSTWTILPPDEHIISMGYQHVDPELTLRNTGFQVLVYS